MIRRSTPTKDAVLNVLTDSKKAMSQETIMKKVDINIDRATVYRVLNRFCEDGVLHRIVAEDGKQYFAVCIKCEEKKLADHHFHFRCTKCETIECLLIEVQFSLEKGYSVESVNCILTGICKDCA
ncbi:transcriptional repressor [Chryseobacterium formosus]|uniref:Transcriptional repressor n=1 Tax=Chryseobacterium formosus TaxID=1537363 RepID=A0ABT3XLL8_9FLAO|nr:transcriptional repressor [Chryseobacterium formosus]MCX8523023.1 transcriptional repressor [Chryseobacterium formosus]